MSRAGGEGGKSEELFGRKRRESGTAREREREITESASDTVLGVLL